MPLDIELIINIIDLMVLMKSDKSLCGSEKKEKVLDMLKITDDKDREIINDLIDLMYKINKRNIKFNNFSKLSKLCCK